MADPLRGRSIHIGGTSHTFRFTFAALRLAHRKLGQQSLQQVLETLNPDSVCELAAAGLLHEGQPVTPEKVAAWLELEPEKYVPLCRAVAEALGEGYRRLAPKDETGKEDTLPGEATAPTTTDGPTSRG